MENKICLDTIIGELTIMNKWERDKVKRWMKEAIRQALVIANEKFESVIKDLNEGSFDGWTKEEINGYKTASITIGGLGSKAILNVNDLII